jgi:putative membrane protein
VRRRREAKAISGVTRHQEDRGPWLTGHRRRPGDRQVRRDAVLSGLVASWVKAFSEPRLQPLAESIVPPSPAQKLEVGADPSGHPQNMPPAVIVGRVAWALGHRELTDRQREGLQRVIHYGFGAGLGIAYSGVAQRWPVATRGVGTLAGLAIYAGTHGSVLPALGIQRPPWRLAPAAVAWEATTHLLFGAALEGSRRALAPRWPPPIRR